MIKLAFLFRSRIVYLCVASAVLATSCTHDYQPVIEVKPGGREQYLRSTYSCGAVEGQVIAEERGATIKVPLTTSTSAKQLLVYGKGNCHVSLPGELIKISGYTVRFQYTSSRGSTLDPERSWYRFSDELIAQKVAAANASCSAERRGPWDRFAACVRRNTEAEMASVAVVKVGNGYEDYDVWLDNGRLIGISVLTLGVGDFFLSSDVKL